MIITINNNNDDSINISSNLLYFKRKLFKEVSLEVVITVFYLVFIFGDEVHDWCYLDRRRQISQLERFKFVDNFLNLFTQKTLNKKKKKIIFDTGCLTLSTCRGLLAGTGKNKFHNRFLFYLIYLIGIFYILLDQSDYS